MTKFITTTIATAFAVALSSAAAAEGTKKFEDLDKDGDGSITQADVPADHELATSFASYDTDKDTKLSRAEFDAYTGMNETEEAE